MMKTYDLTCPDPNCEARFPFEGDPEVLKTEEGETITCPDCAGEWDWMFDADTDTLELLAEEDDQEEDFEDEDEDEDLDEDEEEDE